MATVVVRTKSPSSRTLHFQGTYVPFILTSTTAPLLGHRKQRRKSAAEKRYKSESNTHGIPSSFLVQGSINFHRSTVRKVVILPVLFLSLWWLYPAYVYVNESNQARRPEQRRSLDRNGRRGTCATEMQDESWNGLRHQK
jgi:hypothetical protein